MTYTYKPTKTKTNYKPSSKGGTVKDSFQTPRYATELILPYIRKFPYVWECAWGEGRMGRVLKDAGHFVFGSTLNPVKGSGILDFDFLSTSYDNVPDKILEWVEDGKDFVIVSNPPFSLKEEFVDMCYDLKVPYAFLIPAEFNIWTHKAISRGAQMVVPNRRIDFITPNVLTRIHEGEVWKVVKHHYPQYKNLKLFARKNPMVWDKVLSEHNNIHHYSTIDSVPENLLKKYSSSDFHSFWLCEGLSLEKQVITVDLTISDKSRIL